MSGLSIAGVPAARPLWTRYVLWALALNLPFDVCHPAGPIVAEPVLRSLAINLVLFVLPGLPLAGAMIGCGWLKRLSWMWVVSLSFAVFMAVLVARHLMGLGVESSAFWNATWIITNLAVGLNAFVGGEPAWGLRLRQPYVAIGAMAFLVSYGACFYGACYIVENQEDHDCKIQATAHALLTQLRPDSRLVVPHTTYLTHPPLVHVYVGGSFLYHGQFERLAVYDPDCPEGAALDVGALYNFYQQHPCRLATRTPSMFLAALTAGLLACWIGRLTGSRWLAVLVPFAYIACPEVFVRSCYGGYLAIDHFAALQMLLAADAWARQRDRDTLSTAFLAGLFAAVGDHKLVVLAAAVAVWELLRVEGRALWQRLAAVVRHPLLIGFAAGTALFWVYAAVVNPTAFWLDHIQRHVIDRILHRNPVNLSQYPSLPQMWWEFTIYTGGLLLPLGVWALAMLCKVAGTLRVPSAPVVSDPMPAGWRSAGPVGLMGVDERHRVHLGRLASNQAPGTDAAGVLSGDRLLGGAGTLAAVDRERGAAGGGDPRRHDDRRIGPEFQQPAHRPRLVTLLTNIALRRERNAPRGRG